MRECPLPRFDGYIGIANQLEIFVQAEKNPAFSWSIADLSRHALRFAQVREQRSILVDEERIADVDSPDVMPARWSCAREEDVEASRWPAETELRPLDWLSASVP